MKYHLWIAVVALIAIKAVLLFLFALNSRFVMDEFLQLGYAKYLGHGMFESLWPPKAVGFAIFHKLAHLLGGTATSILLIGRLQTALLACATLALIYACARAMGRDRLRSLLIVLVLLGFSNFMERSFRTIAEPLALFFAAAALLVVLRGSADNRGRLIAAGILSGLSFLATQKAVYFNVALGLGLLGDAALARRFTAGVARGGWLVFGWFIPIIAYCFIFGGAHPIPIAHNLVFGPVEVATTGADAYRGLRHYVTQTLLRNAVLYAFCFGGMSLGLLRFRRLDQQSRIALIFSLVITALVFAHNQPWPYVFIMALPFMALWSAELFDRLAVRPLYFGTAAVVLGIAIAGSFVRNVQYLRIDNKAQLDLVARAEPLVGPGERYFDGIGMLPNRYEPSTLWLDRASVLKTLKEQDESEAYAIFANSPPKVVLWSYRMDAIEPVVAPLIRDSYVAVGPNLRLAGRRLTRDEPMAFKAPVAGRYALYNANGKPVTGEIEIDGAPLARPFRFTRGPTTVTLRGGPDSALLLPEGNYAGILSTKPDNKDLFADVYN